VRDQRPVGLADVRGAADRLDGVVHRTPVLTSRTLDEWTGGRVLLKAESLQRAGAFKLRGAYNAMSRLPAETLRRGVLAYSSGNHAQAVALAARLLGTHATILMPEDAPAPKLAATRGYGAEVLLYDRYREDREALGAALAAERDVRLVPPFDHPDVVAGQGTVALELLEQVEGLDLLVVPIGGGGLAAGCAAAVKGLRPRVEVVGVEPAGRPAARLALERGRPVVVDVPRTILDGQQTSHVGAHPLAVLREHLDAVVGVTDRAVRHALRALLERTHLVVEPSGAAALAAVLDGTIELRGRRAGVVLSGGNLDLARLPELLDAG
jgi:threo-3-hydroxy-L-aspartate ammonia-lyase